MTLTLVGATPGTAPASQFELYAEARAGLLAVLGAPALEFVADGRIAPQGSKQPLGVTKSGKVLMKDDSRYLSAWRSAVTAAALGALPAGWEPLTGPLVIALDFTFAPPERIPAERRGFPATTPDVDKAMRSTFDGLTFGRVWKDDALAVDPHVTSRYVGLFGGADRPGVRVRLWPMP